MSEFVAIDLGECVVIRENSAVVVYGANRKVSYVDGKPTSSMSCRGWTAVLLCLAVFLASGLLCAPLVMTRLELPQTTALEMPTEETAIRVNTTESGWNSATDHQVSTVNPLDVMQADNGLVYQPGLDSGTDLPSENSTGEPNPAIETQVNPGLPAPVDTISDVFEHLDTFHNKFQQVDETFGGSKKVQERFKSSPHFKGPVKILCKPTSDDTLQLMMGPAFNPRYMSTSRPKVASGSSVSLGSPVGGFQNDGTAHLVRHHAGFKHREFVVDGDFQRDLPKEDVFGPMPLWNKQQEKIPVIPDSVTERPAVKRSAAEKFLARIRSKRSFFGASEGMSFGGPTTPAAPTYPWECKSKIVWKDLGDDHYPRFIRSVQCLGDKCWFNHFQCRGKAFTVKVLRRLSDQCVPIPRTGDGPTQYEQEWIFQERSVTFCCECVDF